MLYAITDIETTGSYAAAHGITEISIQVSDGNRILESFETLINPGQTIPRFIQAMTGITDEMVAGAPRFDKVAAKIYGLLSDKIFVAHNVNFDYSFIKSHLEASGYSFTIKKICTVRLGRKIFPGLPSYSLGKFCHSMGIVINDRHRAGGDAAATAQLFHKMVAADTEGHIEKSLLRNSKEQLLPPNVPRAHFEQLPTGPGVYYFHNEKGKIIYVGKALNIRNRVNSHFSSDLDSKQKQNFIRHTHAISFQPVATELMAQILESTEIKKLWPVYNYSQKKWEDVYGIFSYEDQNGYLRLAIEKNKKLLRPLISFHYLVDGHAILRKLIRDFHLCPKLCFMQTDPGPCEGLKEESCFGACEQKESGNVYNKRMERAIASLSNQPSFLIVEKGLQPDQQSCIAVNRGSFIGMGYVPRQANLSDFESVKSFITPYRENSFIRNLVLGYAARYPASIIMLDNSLSYSLH